MTRPNSAPNKWLNHLWTKLCICGISSILGIIDLSNDSLNEWFGSRHHHWVSHMGNRNCCFDASRAPPPPGHRRHLWASWASRESSASGRTMDRRWSASAGDIWARHRPMDPLSLTEFSMLFFYCRCCCCYRVSFRAGPATANAFPTGPFTGFTGFLTEFFLWGRGGGWENLEWVGWPGFYRVFLGFKGFHPIWTRFEWVLPGFTGFYLVSKGLTRYWPGLNRFYWVFLGLKGFNPILTRFEWVLPGFAWFERALPDS